MDMKSSPCATLRTDGARLWQSLMDLAQDLQRIVSQFKLGQNDMNTTTDV